MEFLHLSEWIRRWVDSLPEPQRSIAYKSLYVIAAICALFVLWRVMQREDCLENGKIQTIWYSPRDWIARFQTIKAENQADVPQGVAEFLETSRILLRKTSASVLFLIGLMLAGACIWVGQVISLTFLIAIVLILLSWFVLKRK